MRLRLVTVAILLAIASRSDGRPKHPDPLDGLKEASTLGTGSISESRQDQHRELKDIDSMDQSLRTVATQLLNTTTKREEIIRIPEEKIVSLETPMQVIHISTRVEDAIGEINHNSDENNNNNNNMKFGIPMNSKFGHFEITNPGHAMAMTEEELEREMATATTAAAQKKNQPTTTSMLSTWIQLYPPATTTEGNNLPDIQSNQIHSTTSTKLSSSLVKQITTTSTTTTTKPTAKPTRKTETKPTTKPIEKTTESITSPTTKLVKNPTTTTKFVRISTTSTSPSIENDIDLTDKKRTTVFVSSTNKPAQITKKSPTKSTTPKPKNTTPKNETNKPSKNNSNRNKPLSTRRPQGNKNENVTSTSKIEKVTLKPSIVKTQNRTESTDKPLFITKIKASVLTDAQKSTTAAQVSMKPFNNIISKSNFSTTESPRTKAPTSRVNIVKVKKPIDDTTKIEIQPIRVNPPVLTIEKIEDTKTDIDNKDLLENSKIDVKFDFNSEVANVEVQTQTIESSTPLPVTTTKRPRQSNKRKKNKNRRRRPTTTSTTTLATPINDDESTIIDSLDTDNFQTGIQESKIEPESKAPPSKKKKPNQSNANKPIGTQIYNFLSREVMPSVGVVSLVGLGLGLASYFLYPFGGVIARRNYEVEPNYKYNLDEYGGNYGLSEEEVLSKVYSGMTKNNNNQNHDVKYTPGVVSEKNPNYYRYNGPDQRYQTTGKPHGNRVIYRPIETTNYDVSYRNTEFKYPDVPTTPNYYERQRQTDFVPSVGKLGLGNNRQFVVGNIPKEYSSAELETSPEMAPMQDKIDSNPIQYQADDSFQIENSPISPMPITPAALVSKIDEPLETSYEEVEISPTAVAIEHGPRYLESSIRRKRGILPDITGKILPLAIPRLKAARQERSSVIQVIPSKTEIEKERKEEEEEEDLSNEILDIIDEGLTGKEHHKKRHDDKNHMMMEKHDNHKASDQPLKISINNQATEAAETTATSASSISTTTSSTTITTDNGISKEVSPTTSATTTTTSTTTTTTVSTPTEEHSVDMSETTIEENNFTVKPQETQNGIDIIGIARRIAEVKLRLGLTILKHASEGIARYIGHIQKRLNGDE